MTPYAQLQNTLILVGKMTDATAPMQPVLRNALKHMILAAHGLDVACAQAPEGTDISLYVNTIAWLRHRIEHLAPPPPVMHRGQVVQVDFNKRAVTGG